MFANTGTEKTYLYIRIYTAYIYLYGLGQPYIRVCVRCVLVHVYMCVHAYVCVCAGTCVRAYMVRACPCEGIEGALHLSVLPPQERVSFPS